MVAGKARLAAWGEEGEVMDDSEKIEMILAWAEDHPEFDTNFVEDMEDKLDEHGSLTERQSESLDHIISRWKIEWV